MGAILLVYGLVGLLIVGLCVPLMFGKIPPNGYYGFRTPRTLSDPKVWYPANRVAGRNLVVAGLIMVAGALVTFFLGDQVPQRSGAITLVVIGLVSLFGAVIASFLALRKM